MNNATDKSIILFVNGILTFPGLSRNWNRRAVTHCITRFGRFAESLEYLTFALTRIFFTHYRALKLAKKIFWYQDHGFTVHLVGHSNGANVIFNTLKWFPGIHRIETIQLFSPACSEDADQLGVNRLFRDDRLGKLKLYRAGSDLPLKLANAAGRCFGYGALGLNGFEGLDTSIELAGRADEHYEPTFNHSTWFAKDNFEFYMERIREWAS